MNKILAILAATATVATAAEGADGIRVDHLGTNNTLVRVAPDAQGRYLLMPVQESNDDATVNVLVDGKLEKTIYVRLAKSKVDYEVPLDITPWKGHDVVLNVITTQNRSSVREAKDDACWQNFTLADTFGTANREKFRPAYHHTPLYGWMNDPNGMFYKDGVWHLYYQYNPYGSKWQNMTWGHSSSKDLVHWDHRPLAIEANGLGAVFSGSSVVDRDNTFGAGKDAVVSLYTSAATSQIQSAATSTDNGETFTIYAGNPVITLDSEARDPNMFWHEPTGRWILTLAHALEHEMLIYSSADLKNWTLESSFGKGLGSQDGVWECPDLFPLPVDGNGPEKWMLICNLNPGGPFGGSATQYFIGDFDGHKFTPDTDAGGKVPTKWMDFGKDHYATVSWSDAPDARRTVIGWMSNWQYAAEVPTMQFRSANTLPREVSLFTGADGQVYAASTPSPEVDALRGALVSKARNVSVGASGRRYDLPAANDGICEIDLGLSAAGADSVTVTLSNPAGEKVVMTYDPKAGTLACDRRQSGVTDFSRDFPAVTVAPTFATTKGKLDLRVFVDRSSVEIFGNGGRFAMTNLVFPGTPYTTLTVSAAGSKARIDDLKVYSINPAN